MLHIVSSQKDPKVLDAILKQVLPFVDTPHTVIPFDGEVPQVKPDDVVLVMGGTVVDALKALGPENNGGIKKSQSLNQLRGTAFKWGSGKLMVTQDPFIASIDPSKNPDLVWDVRLACRLHDTNALAPPLGKYRWVEDFTELCAYIEGELERDPKHIHAISPDLETIGLDWLAPPDPEEDFPGARIVTISITPREGYSDVLALPEDGKLTPLQDQQLRWLFSHPRITTVGANLKFDCNWMRYHWRIEVENQRADTMLIGSLLNENRSNSLNGHAKSMTTMGGYDDCVTPDTLVATADLRWVFAGDVQPGDELVGFDETTSYKKRRRMRVAVAESAKRLIKPGVKITLSNGRVIKCSTDHGFVGVRYLGSNGPFEWLRAYELQVGTRLQSVLPVVAPGVRYAAGYMAGLYDGEGYVSSGGNGIQSGLSQKPGLVWEEYLQLLDRYELDGYTSTQKNGDGVMTSKHSGWPTLRMLQLFRPLRLLAKRCYDGKCIPSGAPEVTVASIEAIGDIEVVSLQTSTHTFVAEGIASHNSFNDKHDKSRMDLALKNDPAGFLTYAGGDTDAALRTYHVMKPQLLEDKRLTRFYSRLMQPAAKVFSKMESRGMVVDVPKLRALQSELEVEIDHLTEEALSHIPKRIQYKFADNLSLGRAAVLEEFLFTKNGLNLKPQMMTPSGNAPSTAMEHLNMFADNPEAKAFIDVMKGLNGAKKTLSTFVIGFMKHLRADGRYHPSYMLHRGDYGDSDSDSGTVTGRTSAKDPAVQTIPKHTKWAKKLRGVYVPPPGMAILKGDFSQGELRVTACVAHETNMLKTYKAGIDLHLRTGALINSITLEEALILKASKDPADQSRIKKIRQGGKAGNFGLIYGMSAEGFMNYARVVYGVILTYAEAELFRNAFFAEYKELPAWHARYKNLAKMHGFVRSPLGRIRHLPLINSNRNELRSEAQRQSVNSPIQSCLSDIMQLGMVELDRQYPDLWQFCMTHDDLALYVPEDEVDVWAGRLKETLENVPLAQFDWEPELAFPVDTEYSLTNLAECIEMA